MASESSDSSDNVEKILLEERATQTGWANSRERTLEILKNDCWRNVTLSYKWILGVYKISFEHSSLNLVRQGKSILFSGSVNMD